MIILTEKIVDHTAMEYLHGLSCMSIRGWYGWGRAKDASVWATTANAVPAMHRLAHVMYNAPK